MTTRNRLWPYLCYAGRLLRPPRRSGLLAATLAITGRCNGLCRYCNGEYPNGQPGRELTVTQQLDLIDQLAYRGARYIMLTGGEPLLVKEIGRLIDRAQQAGCLCTVDTNGFFLPERILDVRQADRLSVSLDGEQAAHDKWRGDGSFERALQGIEVALAEGARVTLACVLTQDAVGDIDALVSRAIRLGVNIKFSIPYTTAPTRRGELFESIRPADETLRAALRKIAQLKRDGAPILYAPATYAFAADWPDFARYTLPAQSAPRRTPICRAGERRCFISYDGSVYPCCQLQDSFEAKRWPETNLDEALRHARETKPCAACYDLGSVEHHRQMELHVSTLISVFRDVQRVNKPDHS